eukprot:3723401-Pyramimonas_sp.AAC.1
MGVTIHTFLSQILAGDLGRVTAPGGEAQARGRSSIQSLGAPVGASGAQGDLKAVERCTATCTLHAKHLAGVTNDDVAYICVKIFAHRTNAVVQAHALTTSIYCSFCPKWSRGFLGHRQRGTRSRSKGSVDKHQLILLQEAILGRPNFEYFAARDWRTKIFGSDPIGRCPTVSVFFRINDTKKYL